MAAFIGGYAAVWSAFGALAFAFDAGLHAVVESSPWLHERDWAIGAGVLALAGAFQFTPLKDACLDKCRHPGAVPAPPLPSAARAADFASAPATERSASAAAGR